MEQNSSELLESIHKGSVDVVLGDVARQYKEQNVKVAGLVVPKLDQAVVG